MTDGAAGWQGSDRLRHRDHYSARSFVRWVRLEATAPKYGERRSTSDVGRAVEVVSPSFGKLRY